MHDTVLCKLYIRRYFVGILNSRAVKFAIISENKVLTNNSEFTVIYGHKKIRVLRKKSSQSEKDVEYVQKLRAVEQIRRVLTEG